MGKWFNVFVWFALVCQSLGDDLEELTPDFTLEDRWMYRNSKGSEMREPCMEIHPSTKDIVKRFHAILT